MKTNRFLIATIISFLFIAAISCKENNASMDSSTFENDIMVEKNIEPILYKIDFPDTVLIDKKYNGTIEYKSILDSITRVFGDLEKDRYVRFIMATSNSNNFSNEVLKSKIVKDTFGALDNRNIPFYDVQFSQAGELFIVGVINDLVIIDLHQKNIDGEDLVRLIENEVRVTHKVYVIDSLEN